MPPESDLAQSAGNNSSDFVRKLYKMLEDPAYRSVVRWGNDGDSFVVLENEKFTKTILPKHFKHSNFASFVRQLNKYDFHKVRQNEENGTSPYGQNAWEFKHPEFNQHNKDNLDNIRRKAPAPRKAPVNDDSFGAAQQISVMAEQLNGVVMQQQSLQEQYFYMQNQNKLLTEEVYNLQRMTRAHNQITAEIVSHLNSLDERRRNSRHHSAHSSHSGQSGQFHGSGLGLLPDSADEPAPELRRVQELLSRLGPDTAMNPELERLNNSYHNGASPPDSASSGMLYGHPGAGVPLGYDPMNDMRHMVYPVGHNTGIDPFHPEHMQNHQPYARPASNPNPAVEMPAQVTPPTPREQPSKSVWGVKKPRVLLVEDDTVCARIGSKFLSQVECAVSIASNGLEAVNKVNNEPDQYDLIFMDIIMPEFDGIYATNFIRQTAPTIPIVAMTSNITMDDIAKYFYHGMNDVLAKPFTKDGMIRTLKKHLNHMLRNPQPLSQMDDMGQPGIMAGLNPSTPGYAPVQGMNQSGLSASGTGSATVKYEGTPSQSPAATTTSWNSPGGPITHSPQVDSGGYMTAGVNGSGQMVLTPGGTQRGQHFQGGPPPPMQQPPAPRRMHDGAGGGMGDDRPEKRQRLYAQAPSSYGQ